MKQNKKKKIKFFFFLAVENIQAMDDQETVASYITYQLGDNVQI